MSIRIRKGFNIWASGLFFALILSGFNSGSNDFITSKNANLVSAMLVESKLPRKSFEAEKIKNIDKFFRERHIRGRFNGVVLFAQKGHIFQKSYGYSSFKDKEYLSNESIFQLASISKPLTATAILILAQRNAINLSDKIENFIPDFPSKNITIEQLLTHQSGLSDYVYFTPGVWQKNTMSNQELIDFIEDRNIKRKYKLNTFHYSNTNYAILASIVEIVSKDSFTDFVRKNIFEPAGMNSTFFFTEKQRLEYQKQTIGHNAQRVVYPPNYLDNVLGDKGVYSTAQDLLRFDIALKNNIILSEKWQSAAYANQVCYLSDSAYGYGWRLSNYMDKQIIYHNGWWHGYKGRFIRIPSEDKTIIILENQAKSSIPLATLVSLSEKLFDDSEEDFDINQYHKSEEEEEKENKSEDFS